MKVIKKELPEGVRKKFITKIGKKVKILNSLYYDKKNKKTTYCLFFLFYISYNLCDYLIKHSITYNILIVYLFYNFFFY